MNEVIRTATSAEDYQAFARLVAEYVEWCRARYQADAWFVSQVFGHQSLATELEALSTSYGPPNGVTLLAVRDGQVCGGGAWRRLSDVSCEMKRLFVPDRFSGHGTGRRLCNALVGSARDQGFQVMKLDTGNLLKEAIALYQSIGFMACPPYHAYPKELMLYLVFMEMQLAGGATA